MRTAKKEPQISEAEVIAGLRLSVFTCVLQHRIGTIYDVPDFWQKPVIVVGYEPLVVFQRVDRWRYRLQPWLRVSDESGQNCPGLPCIRKIKRV